MRYAGLSLSSLFYCLLSLYVSILFDIFRIFPLLQFFVAANHKIPDEKLWKYKYSIRTAMLPKFISEQLAEKVASLPRDLMTRLAWLENGRSCYILLPKSLSKWQHTVLTLLATNGSGLMYS